MCNMLLDPMPKGTYFNLPGSKGTVFHLYVSSMIYFTAVRIEAFYIGGGWSRKVLPPWGETILYTVSDAERIQNYCVFFFWGGGWGGGTRWLPYILYGGWQMTNSKTLEGPCFIATFCHPLSYVLFLYHFENYRDVLNSHPNLRDWPNMSSKFLISQIIHFSQVYVTLVAQWTDGGLFLPPWMHI